MSLGRKKRPVKVKEMKAALTKLGFSYKSQKGSHEQWTAENPFRKVTVDCHHAPFSGKLFKYMARQAKVSANELYRCCTEKNYTPDLKKLSKKMKYQQL